MYGAGEGTFRLVYDVLGEQDGPPVADNLETEVVVVDQVADSLHAAVVLPGQDILLGDGLGVVLEDLVDLVFHDGGVAVGLIAAPLGHPRRLLPADQAEGQPDDAHHPGQGPGFGVFRKGRKEFHGFPPSSLYPWPQTTFK